MRNKIIAVLIALPFLLIFSLLIIVLAWRMLSRRQSIPCPSAFIWMLEHRLMENVAGAQAIIERARIETGMRVLDAGCGPGRVTIPIARHVGPAGEVVAVDVQESMLERLNERVHQTQLNNITALLAPLGGGILGEERFDRAIMITVLGEIPDRKAALTEIFYALKPGGILSITEVLPDPHYQSRKSIYALAGEVGFQVEVAYSSFRSYTMNLTRPGTGENSNQ